MPRAIVVGASSGIGRALAVELAGEGYDLGLAARRVEALDALAGELPTRGVTKRIDVMEPEAARRALRELIDEMGGVGLVVLSSGVGYTKASWEEEKHTIDVNVTGFVALASVAMEHFRSRGRGHLVGISSVSALRAAGVGHAYSASKAFISRYMEGLSLEADAGPHDIQVTDVKPGYVETPMTEDRTGLFWVATADEAARQIARAIRKRKRHVYITRRWRLIAWLMKLLPYRAVLWLSGGRRRTKGEGSGTDGPGGTSEPGRPGEGAGDDGGRAAREAAQERSPDDGLPGAR